MENGEKRVLFINHSVRDGGPGRSLFYILKHLDRSAVRPFVLIPRDDIFSERLKEHGLYRDVIVDPRFPDGFFRPPASGLPGRSTAGGMPGAVISALMKTVYAAANVAKIAALVLTFAGVIRERRIDLVHCNGTIAKITGAFIGMLHGVPVVWHVRNIQQTPFMKFLITRLARIKAVRRIICVSEATAVQFGKNPKVCVIHNGIDPGDFDPAAPRERKFRRENSIPGDTVVVGNAGRVVPRKGYGHFIEAAAELLKDPALKNGLKFVIVGDTPGFFTVNHLSELKERVERMGIADSFIFTGFKRDVTDCVADFDIFLIPSNYPDPFPRSVIEAMCFSIPVVGFAIGGIEESVEDGVTGLLSPPGDTRHMTENVRRLIEDAGMRKAMGSAARKRVRALYQAADKTAEIQDVLLEAAGAVDTQR